MSFLPLTQFCKRSSTETEYIWSFPPSPHPLFSHIFFFFLQMQKSIKYSLSIWYPLYIYFFKYFSKTFLPLASHLNFGTFLCMCLFSTIKYPCTFLGLLLAPSDFLLPLFLRYMSGSKHYIWACIFAHTAPLSLLKVVYRFCRVNTLFYLFLN